MEQVIRGKAFVVGDNNDTDQIIPAKYLSYNPADPEERKYFGKYALSGVPAGQSGLPDGRVPFVADGELTSDFAVVVGGRNFGCGSSRVPLETAERLVDVVATGDEVEIDLAAGELKNLTRAKTYPLKDLGDVADIVAAGGIFEYARQSGLLEPR